MGLFKVFSKSDFISTFFDILFFYNKKEGDLDEKKFNMDR